MDLNRNLFVFYACVIYKIREKREGEPKRNLIEFERNVACTGICNS
jgi:hypothetical protein